MIPTRTMMQTWLWKLLIAQDSVNLTGIFSTERIGTLDKQKTRPLKIKFEYKSVALDLLLQSKNLKDDKQCNSVFIVPARSKEERIEHKQRVQHFKLARSQNPKTA